MQAHIHSDTHKHTPHSHMCTYIHMHMHACTHMPISVPSPNTLCFENQHRNYKLHTCNQRICRYGLNIKNARFKVLLIHKIVITNYTNVYDGQKKFLFLSLSHPSSG